MDRPKVFELFDGKRAESPYELDQRGIARDERDCGGRRLLFAMRVVDEQHIQVCQGDVDPSGIRGRN